MNITIVLGTRPEIIKMSPIIKTLDSCGLQYSIIHTGQHYTFEMDRIFFRELGLNPASRNLNIGSGSHGETIGKAIVALENTLRNEKPDILLVQGDTNAVLATSLVASRMHIPLGHVEAGLRSHDRRMPEEYNRIICDHLAEYLFTPTSATQKNLKSEGISKRKLLYHDRTASQKIFLTGNTIVDAIQQCQEHAKRSQILSKLTLTPGEYFLITAHREENVDHKNRLYGIIQGLQKVARSYQIPLLYPMHPRTLKMLQKFQLMNELEKIHELRIINPVGFFDLLALETNAALVLTDSGGIQEETCILHVPCVVLRDTSDRPESLQVGASALAGCDPTQILRATDSMLRQKPNWDNPFGDGNASLKIIDILTQAFV